MRLLLAGILLAPADGGPAVEIFRDRILPIHRSPKPSSCVECHLGGVDLKDYIFPDAR